MCNITVQPGLTFDLAIISDLEFKNLVRDISPKPYTDRDSVWGVYVCIIIV